MSRPLVLAAAAAFFVAGLLPILVMLLRIEPADAAAVFEPRIASLLGRTIALGLGAAGVAFVLGLPFGFLVARTDIPGASALRTLGTVPILLPPLILAMVWTVLFDLRGPVAAVLILGASTFPLVSLFTARAFERIDARKEEAALMVGGLRAVLAVELPLVLPAALSGACLAFAFAINDFAVPDYIAAMGYKFNVYADEVFANWKQTNRPGLAVASALPLIALTLVALVPALALRRSGALGTLGGDFRQPRTLRLGRWRWPAFAAVLALVLATCLVPPGRLLWEAAGGPGLVRSGEPLDLPTLAARLRGSFATGLERSRVDLRNSLVYSLCAATVCVPLALVIGHAIERVRRRGVGRAMELASLVPLAAPAVLFGVGVIATWNRDWAVPFYESGAIVVLLFAGRFAPLAILVTSGAVASLRPELEESAAVSGVGPVARLGAIVAPSLKGSLVASWVLVFVFAMRELDAAIFLGPANKTAMFRVYNGVHFGRDDFIAALALLLVFAILTPGLLWSLFARRRLELLP